MKIHETEQRDSRNRKVLGKCGSVPLHVGSKAQTTAAALVTQESEAIACIAIGISRSPKEVMVLGDRAFLGSVALAAYAA